MTLLTLDDGNGVREDLDAIGIELSSAKMTELRREGCVKWTEPGGTTVVIGHEDALESLLGEVENGE